MIRQACASCHQIVIEDWTYCPFCSATRREALIVDEGTTVGQMSSTNECTPPVGPPGGKATAFKPEVWTGAFESFPLALAEIAKATMAGAKVPGHHLHGWKEVPEGFKVYSNAMARHALAESQVTNPTDHFDEVTATTWNSMARYEHYLRDIELARNGG